MSEITFTSTNFVPTWNVEKPVVVFNRQVWKRQYIRRLEKRTRFPILQFSLETNRPWTIVFADTAKQGAKTKTNTKTTHKDTHKYKHKHMCLIIGSRMNSRWRAAKVHFVQKFPQLSLSKLVTVQKVKTSTT